MKLGLFLIEHIIQFFSKLNYLKYSYYFSVTVIVILIFVVMFLLTMVMFIIDEAINFVANIVVVNLTLIISMLILLCLPYFTVNSAHK